MDDIFDDNLELIESLKELKLSEIAKQPKLLNSHLFDLGNDLNNIYLKELRLLLSNKTTTQSIQPQHPQLLDLCRDLDTLKTKSVPIRSNLNESLKLLDLNNELQFILRLPIKLESLINSGNYKESLSLLERFSLIDKASSALSIELKVDLAKLKALLINNLISSLSANRRLSDLSHSVRLLERATELDPRSLSIVFLKSRLSLFNKNIPTIDNEDSIKSYFDFVRQFLTDLTTQFNSIFANLDSRIDLLPFIYSILANLFELLNSNLTVVNDTVALSSIAGSLTYLNHSFASIGLDASPSISKIIQTNLLTFIDRSFSACSDVAKNYLQSTLQSSKPLSLSLLSETARLKVSQKKLLSYPNTQMTFTLNPPHQISNHPFLAHWLNAVLNVLNALRLLAPIRLKVQLIESLDQSILAIARIFSVFVVHYTPSRDPDLELKSLYLTINAFTNHAVPYTKLALTQYIYHDNNKLPYNDDLKLILDRLTEWTNFFEK